MVVRCLMAGAGLIVALALSGCGGAGTIYKKNTLGDLDTLSIDARQRLAFVGDYTDRGGKKVRALCMESSPEAAVAQAATLAAGQEATVPTLVNGAVQNATNKASVSGATSESLASLSLKTQTIQIFRDGYYRLCEGLLNGVIDEGDYEYVLASVDSTMIALAAVDALGDTATAAPAVSITTGPVTYLDPKDNTSKDLPAGSTIIVQPPAGGSEWGSGNEVRATAIRDIALKAFELSRERRYLLDRKNGLR